MAKPRGVGGREMNPAPLYACVLAREFPAQAMLRLRPGLRERSFAVMDGAPPCEGVCSLNKQARLAGVERGMTRAELAPIPGIDALVRSQAEEAAAKAALLETAGGFSPRIEDQSTDSVFCCVIDITGTGKLFGPPPALAQQIQSHVHALGVTASVAISANFHAAVALARGYPAKVTIIRPGDVRAALAPLALTVLDLSGDQARTFSLWGIRTLAMLADLPEEALIARMGQEGRRLRLAARGALPHLFLPVEAAFTLRERMDLDTPVELLDSLLFVIGVMLGQLIERASSRSLALASVIVTLSLDDGGTHTRTVRPALATNDRQFWLKLLHLDLEAHPPASAVVAVTVTAEPGDTSRVQLGLFAPQLPEPSKLDVTLARLLAVVGEDRVGRAVLEDSHRPDAFRMEPFTVPSSPALVKPLLRQPRPAKRRLRSPENAGVVLRDERPISLTFRARRYSVERAYGPWRMDGDWWLPTLWDARQWDIVARDKDGGLLCCCLVCGSATNTWRIEALYD